jgi:hypothetical protein
MMKECIGGKPMSKSNEKMEWSGRIVAVQPRIRLMRSFDQRSHNYLGYALRVAGVIGDEPGEFITSGIKILKDAEDAPPAGPPFQGVPPDLETYRSRGHRRLDPLPPGTG